MVATRRPKWGETPLAACVERKPGAKAIAEELIAHCGGLLAGYKVPNEVRSEAIPKTSTGKIEKFQLRERANRALGNRVRSTRWKNRCCCNTAMIAVSSR